MGHNDLQIERMDDFSILNDFYCGVKEFDEFIHSGEFEENVILKLSVPYSVKENGELVAFFSLACDSLLLEDDYKEDFSTVRMYKTLFLLCLYKKSSLFIAQ